MNLNFCFPITCALCFALPVVAEDLSFHGRVVGVADGDTITVLNDTRETKIRLAEIDCPEKSQDFGQAAKSFTSAQVFSKDVQVHVTGKDRYGRVIALVSLDKEPSLNSTLVQAGLAWCYTKYSNNSELLDLERRAREQHIGLWSKSDAMPPWQFRHQKVGKK